MLKGKAFPLYDNQAQRRGTGIAAPVLEEISATSRQLYPQGKRRGTHRTQDAERRYVIVKSSHPTHIRKIYL
jgi:hypothetical protein